MPHIKVKPFDTKKLLDLNPVEFLGVEESFKNELILTTLDGKKYAFDIIKRDNEFLIKPNKITRGSNVERIKKFLNYLTDELNLETIIKNTNPKNYIVKKEDEFLKPIEYFYDFKSDFKKIKLEVGFGSGRHLLYRARREKDTLFIGIEIHTPSISQILKQIHLQNLDNIIVVDYDARLLLEMLPSNILEQIYVHFPVPWDKKPHRRVISQKFVSEAIRVLKKGGLLELRTDSEKYYQYALELFSSFKNARFLVEKNIDIEVISKYEERWRRMNKNIYTISFESLEESANRSLNIDFSFNLQKNEAEIKKDSIVKDGFFVHFSKEFKSVKDKSRVLECSFGDFSMPERKLIYISDIGARYYPTPPVKSFTNYKAHKYIQEVLNGKCN